MRDLDHDARAVTALMIGAFTAAVFQVFQDIQSIRDDVIRPLSLDIDDEADAAGIMFVGRIIQALRCGQILKMFFHCAVPLEICKEAVWAGCCPAIAPRNMISVKSKEESPRDLSGTAAGSADSQQALQVLCPL